MADRLEFKGKLQGILNLSVEQGQKITLNEVEQYFEEDQLSEEQIGLVCEYLLSQKVAVSGYERSGGVIHESAEEKVKMSEEERAYVEEYSRDIEGMKAQTPSDALLLKYLPKVAEEAVKMYHPQVFIGDVIQEGSVSLMLALKECESAQTAVDETAVMEAVRAGMAALIEEQTEVKRQDKRMVEQVSELDETIKSMTEELGRKVAVDEVAEKLGITEGQIADILKLAGEEVEG